jgi:hypothetical protein
MLGLHDGGQNEDLVRPLQLVLRLKQNAVSEKHVAPI